jgi:thiamine phosphate synthase YjbQ (UPF0047 family)
MFMVRVLRIDEGYVIVVCDHEEAGWTIVARDPAVRDQIGASGF